MKAKREILTTRVFESGDRVHVVLQSRGHDLRSQILFRSLGGNERNLKATNLESADPAAKASRDIFGLIAAISIIALLTRSSDATESDPRPPFNAEYLLYLLVGTADRDILIGDLIEGYSQIRKRFNKRRADLWFYKQVIGSLFPLLRRLLFKIGALVWLGRILQRLIS